MAPNHAETILWLIRHPEPTESAKGRCYGSLDVALPPEGIRHAHSLATALASERFAAIYTSPRQRCMETTRIIATGRSCPLEIVDALRELDFGIFEGRSYDEIAALDPDCYRQWMENPTEVQFPGGESFSQISDRVIGATRDLLARHQGDSIIFVTHGGPIRIILADALGMPSSNIFRIGQRYGAINRIRYPAGIPIVELMNTDNPDAARSRKPMT
jgi:alpha-ribazole phosphatase